MNLQIRPATSRDAFWVIRKLRKADKREVETSSGLSAVEGVLASCRLSQELYTGTLEGDPNPCLVFGCRPDPEDPTVGVIWLLGTDRMLAGRLAVVRAARKQIKEWLQKYQALHNVADCRNTLHLRWLKLMGFSFGPVVQVNEHPFQYFYIGRS